LPQVLRTQLQLAAAVQLRPTPEEVGAILQRLHTHLPVVAAVEPTARLEVLAAGALSQVVVVQVIRHLPPPRKGVTEVAARHPVLGKVVLAVAALPILA
jgi:hypothetical protein